MYSNLLRTVYYFIITISLLLTVDGFVGFPTKCLGKICYALLGKRR